MFMFRVVIPEGTILVICWDGADAYLSGVWLTRRPYTSEIKELVFTNFKYLV